jgi:hypothetical protein
MRKSGFSPNDNAVTNRFKVINAEQNLWQKREITDKMI